MYPLLYQWQHQSLQNSSPHASTVIPRATSVTSEHQHHGLINYIDCWYFRPSFVNCCHSDRISWFNSPPLPWVNKYTLYTYTWGGGYGPQTDKHLPQSPFTCKFFRWRHFPLPSMSLIFQLALCTRGDTNYIRTATPLNKKCFSIYIYQVTSSSLSHFHSKLN